MTGNENSLSNPQPYNGNNSVLLGNGDSLPISHTGNIPLSLGTSKLHLSDVFLVPALDKNLLSVARFTNDNSVFFVFAPNFYQIYDLHTTTLLFQGPCKDGLYPMSFSSIPSTPSALATVSSSVWHNRLGHPSSSVLSKLSSSLGSTFPSHSKFCTGCALGKSTQLPFSINKNYAPSFFYLIHSVWMSPITYVTDFHYYVLFTDEYSRYS